MPQLNSTLKRFFAYYRPHRRLFLLDFSCAILSGLLELGFPIAVKTFVDKLLPSQNWGLILGATAGLLAIYLVNTALQYIVMVWSIKKYFSARTWCSSLGGHRAVFSR